MGVREVRGGAGLGELVTVVRLENCRDCACSDTADQGQLVGESRVVIEPVGVSLPPWLLYTGLAPTIHSLLTEITMKTLIKMFSALALAGLLAQPALAQDIDSALKQIADIVASINHFPSDADKAALAEIAANQNYPEGLRNMATTVANISHAATAEGKQMMADVQANTAAPESARALAGVIASINHMASDEAKATLAQHFP